MASDLWVFFLAGVQDAVSPTQVALAGSLALALIFLREAGKRYALVFGAAFLTALLSLSLVSDFRGFEHSYGIPGWLTFRMAGIFLWGVSLMGFGIAFLRERFVGSGGSQRRFAGFFGPVSGQGCLRVLFGSGFAAGLFFLATAWPLHFRIPLKGQLAFLPGKFLLAAVPVLIYELFRNAGSLVVFVLFLSAIRPAIRIFLRERRTLIAIVLSAFYLATGGSLLFFFYMATMKPFMGIFEVQTR